MTIDKDKKSTMFKSEIAIASEENARLATELALANKNLAIAIVEKSGLATELVIANKELAIESAEKAMRAAELVIVNKELAIVNDRLQTSLLETIDLARQLVELRDPFTAGHEQHVGQLAKAIAAQMGFDESRQDGLMVAGYLHDIGKIIIPVEILAKLGKISIEEFSLIKNHVQAGYDLLKDVGFKWDIAEPIYEHHERLDGSGYPRKLRADQISIDGRILGVADVVESIFHYRPYRPEKGMDAALSVIKQGRGTLYDASVVDACVKVFEDGFEFAEIKDMRIGGTPSDHYYNDADNLSGRVLGDHKSKKPVV